MKTLLKNCLHGSKVYLLEDFDPNEGTKTIIKSSSCAEGIASLYRELEGINWYNHYAPQPIKVDKAHETAFYLSLKYEFIEGKTHSCLKGYDPNKVAIASILDHYCSIWSQEPLEGSNHILHGDLSLGNVIFTSKGLVIIDWEYFNKKSAPKGFDGLYLLFESLWYECENKTVNFESLKHASQMIQKLNNNRCLGPAFLKNPLRETLNFIQSNPHLWNSQLLSEKILPILFFNEEYIETIDKFLNAQTQ